MPNYEDFKKYDELTKQKKEEPPPPPPPGRESLLSKLLKPLRSSKD
ncbi:MAG: hypothetical protein WD602_03925 [Actinomycetota bacterium]